MRNYNQEFENLMNSLGDLFQEDKTAANEHLIANNIEPSLACSDGVNSLRKLIVKLKVEQKNKNQLNLISIAKNKLSEFQKQVGGDIKSNIALLLSGSNQQEFKPLWNNLSSINEHDLIDMLDEAQLLEIIEKIKVSEDSSKKNDY